ncbi:MAG: adenylyltransferase/cytidyltransferase family protein [Nanoarchaeota archaeon]|nr:adenylyltransferase/cytidyltransferase family protein [Nanoarchaeota archaeon]
MSIKVMVFGTFDIYHKGHEFYFKKAKKFGDELVAVIARDETVLKIKKQLPKNNELQRLKILQQSKLVDKVILGNLGDKFKVIEDELPQVLVFGYDQQSFNIGIKEELEKRNLSHIKIIQLEEAFKPEIYKSSKLK